MYRKKNKFLTFLCSLLPGAAEMYMGFMKMGLSLMTPFLCLVGFSAAMTFGAGLFVALLVWVYSFFHAHNLASLPDELFAQVEDTFLFPGELPLFEVNNRKIRRIIAVVLIVVGASMVHASLYSNFSWMLSERVQVIWQNINYALPKLAVGLGIIVLGISMIRGKKQELDAEDEQEDKEVREYGNGTGAGTENDTTEEEH